MIKLTISTLARFTKTVTEARQVRNQEPQEYLMPLMTVLVDIALVMRKNSKRWKERKKYN